MEIYDKILKYLSDNDNGEYIEITDLSDNFNNLKSKVFELSKKGLIEVKSTGVYFLDDKVYGNKENLKRIYAKILLPGYEYLEKKIVNKNSGEISKDKKLEALNLLIYELKTHLYSDISQVKNYVKRTNELISYIDGKDSEYILEISLVINNEILAEDWDEKFINVLEKLKNKIDFKETGNQSEKESVIYVSQTRIDELNNVNNDKFDLIKLVRLCRELNDAYRLENYYTVGMLVRTVMNHVPPIFSQPNFDSVVNQYKSNGNVKSFRETMEHLEKSSRKIADSYVHSIVRNQEVLPTEIQVDFRQGLDILLGEIVRVLK